MLNSKVIHVFCLLVAIGFLASVTSVAVAEDSVSHRVSVIVLAINEIAVVGGDVRLTVDKAFAGEDPDPVIDSTTADLLWTVNEENKKITVEADSEIENATLTVLAMNVKGGNATDRVSLGLTPVDLVIAVANTRGACDLSYQLSVAAIQGSRQDKIYTITYTITSWLL